MAKKILLVADISNLYYTINERFNAKLDFQFLYNFVRGEEEIYRAIAYGAEREREATAFKDALRNIGFEIQYKKPKTFLSGDRKADWDVGIAIDVVKILENVDIVFFATADGDLAPCVEYVKSRGKIANIIGCKVSYELKNVADYVCEINEDFLEKNNERFARV